MTRKKKKNKRESSTRGIDQFSKQPLTASIYLVGGCIYRCKLEFLVSPPTSSLLVSIIVPAAQVKWSLEWLDSSPTFHFLWRWMPSPQKVLYWPCCQKNDTVIIIHLFSFMTLSFPDIILKLLCCHYLLCSLPWESVMGFVKVDTVFTYSLLYLRCLNHCLPYITHSTILPKLSGKWK
jgi:hypothetical protein